MLAWSDCSIDPKISENLVSNRHQICCKLAHASILFLRGKQKIKTNCKTLSMKQFISQHHTERNLFLYCLIERKQVSYQKICLRLAFSHI